MLFDATRVDLVKEPDAEVESYYYPSPPPPSTVDIASRANGSEDHVNVNDPATATLPVEFTVTRTGGSMTGSLDVEYKYAGGTATAGDFINPSGKVTIPAGASSVVLKLYPHDDAELEPTETVLIELPSPPAGARTSWPTPRPRPGPGDVADNDYVLKSVQVGFDSQTIKRDDGSGDYAKPQWLDADADGNVLEAGDQRFPVSYVRSRPGAPTHVTVEPKFTVDGKLNRKYLLRGGGMGLANSGLTWEKELTIAPGTTVIETSITSTGALGDKIDLATLTINWRITHLGQDKAYRSDHRTYVTGFPAGGHFETVLDIGCRNAKGLRPANPGEPEPDASNRDREVVDAIWADFADNVVYRVDGVMMKYNHDPGRGHWAADMLAQAEGRGQCTAWANLLVLTLEAQGFSSTSTRIDPPGDKFAVRAMPAQGSNGANYLPGTLAREGFNFHQVVRIAIYPDRIYDPSYGGRTIKDDGRSVELKYEDDNITHFRFGEDNWVLNILGDPIQVTFTP